MIASVILRQYSIRGGTFTYGVSEKCIPHLQIGQIVEVPFRNKREIAIVVDIMGKETLPVYKDISSIVREEPVIQKFHIAIAKWIASHYCSPLHKAVDLFVPRYVWEQKKDGWIKRQRKIFLQSTDVPLMGKKQKKLIAFLQANNGADISSLPSVLGHVSLSYLHGLEHKGAIRIEEGKIIPPYFNNYNLNDTSVIQEKGLKALNAEQSKAFDVIKQKRGFQTYVLHGVTGSGKTEIYLHMAYHLVQEGKQIIILVPEIALTPQLIGYFYRVFGTRIAVIHSRLSEGEKYAEWMRIRLKESFVVIGSRSALFSPVRDLGAIIIDEEHEWTYKNDQNPRYDTRTVAEKMALELQIPLILGSATPSVEKYYAASRAIYNLIELRQKIIRVNGHNMV